MQWLNTRIDGGPNHKDEVLISINGVYHIAVYDAKNKTYISKRNNKSFKASEVSVYWTSIEPP